MKRVYSGGTLADVAHAQNLLEHAGIRSFMKNVNLGGALGDLPFLDCAPELWVLVDADAKPAQRVLREALSAQLPPGAAAWRCPQCREPNDPQFGVCWSCGAAAPG